MSTKTNLTSGLSRARGHGAAGHGVHHWWHQRLTALALVPLGVWLMASLLVMLRSSDPFQVADWLSSPLNALLLTALLVALFWHAKLGLQVVIEDYVHHRVMKYALLIGNTLLTLGLAMASVLAVLKLHLFHIISGV